MPRHQRISRSIPLPDAALPGAPSPPPQAFSPHAPLPQAPLILNQRPRPATTRYPITNEAF